MKKLSKEQQKELASMAASLREKQTKVNAAIEAYNKVVEEAKTKVTEAVDEYNGSVSDVNNYIGELKGQMDDYYDERSEKWQEGEAGTDYDTWRDNFTELDDLEVELPESLEEVSPDHAQTIDDLPAEPG